MTRKLDALVAEWVEEYECVCDEEAADCPIHAYDDHDMLLPYSTDISVAWKLIDKIITDDNDIDQVELGGGWQDEDGWYCLFIHGEFGEWPYATAEMPAFAICLAVLRAVGVPEAEIQEALNE